MNDFMGKCTYRKKELIEVIAEKLLYFPDNDSFFHLDFLLKAAVWMKLVEKKYVFSLV